MRNNILLEKPGDTSVLRPTQRDSFGDTDLSKDKVLIDVSYSGINFADLMMRQGLYPDAPAYPFIPGYEVSGIVRAVGEDISSFSPGDRVMAGCFFGGYSSEVLVEEFQVKKVPESWSLEQAAATPVSYLTAYTALFEQARYRPGDTLFIDCASGALGQMVLHLIDELDGNDQRASVYGATSTESKIEFLEKAGVIAMSYEKWRESDLQVDIIINSKGAKTISDDLNRLRPCGRIVCLGVSDILRPKKRNLWHALKTFWQMPKFSSIELINHNRGVFGLNLLHLLEQKEVVQRVWQQANLDRVDPPNVCKVFPWEEASQAHDYIEAKKSRGKVLLNWS